MRQIAAKALIALLVLIIATILIAPQVDLDPVAPRLEWAACLMIIFLAYLASMVEFYSAISGIAEPSIARIFLLHAGPPHLNPDSSQPSLLRC